MDDLRANLGDNVRRLREARGLSQQRIAQLSGIPRPTWASLESGAANPTLAVLSRAAAALQVSIEELIGPPRTEARLFPAAGVRARKRQGGTLRPLLPEAIPGLDISRLELAPGGHLVGVPHTAGTREYLTCERGQIELVASGERWKLGPGDSLSSAATSGTPTATSTRGVRRWRSASSASRLPAAEQGPAAAGDATPPRVLAGGRALLHSPLGMQRPIRTPDPEVAGVKRDAIADGSAGARQLPLLSLAVLLLLPAPARAIDPLLCADDGVTEIPPFAAGRDAGQCLLLDPGNGAPLVPFQYEFFHRVGIDLSAEDGGDDEIYSSWIDLQLKDYGNCRTAASGSFCSLLIWDTTFDNYLSVVGRDDDIIHLGAEGFEYLYFKDSNVVNGWKCSGVAWEGPNGTACPEAESGAHSDGIQFRGTIANDGWLIFQDSNLLNGHTDLMRLQYKSSDYEPHGNLLLQGVQLGTVNTPIGASVNWIDDCRGRGSSSKCDEPVAVGTMPLEEIWYVDVYGNGITRLGRDGFTKKVVIVNTGCGRAGCGGPIEFDDGWAHPVARSDPSGPGTCPNGYVGNGCQGDSAVACFCYTSIENALADTVTPTSNIGDCPAPHCPHARPPFLQNSDSGWENPPSAQ
jgi:transcriptional regulator with XRE-family HTH domain